MRVFPALCSESLIRHILSVWQKPNFSALSGIRPLDRLNILRVLFYDIIYHLKNVCHANNTLMKLVQELTDSITIHYH